MQLTVRTSVSGPVILDMNLFGISVLALLWVKPLSPRIVGVGTNNHAALPSALQVSHHESTFRLLGVGYRLLVL